MRKFTLLTLATACATLAILGAGRTNAAASSATSAPSAPSDNSATTTEEVVHRRHQRACAARPRRQGETDEKACTPAKSGDFVLADKEHKKVYLLRSEDTEGIRRRQGRRDRHVEGRDHPRDEDRGGEAVGPASRQPPPQSSLSPPLAERSRSQPRRTHAPCPLPRSLRLRSGNSGTPRCSGLGRLASLASEAN